MAGASRKTNSRLCLIPLILLAGCAQIPEQPVATVTPTPSVSEVTPEPSLPKLEPIEVVAVGDIMLGTDYPEDRLPEPGRLLLEPVTGVLRSADITFGNFEGTFLAGGEPEKKCKDKTRCYVFRTPPEFVGQLVSAGFNVMSLGNNHARDFGEAGWESSMRTLQQAGIRHSGREGNVASWTVKNRQVALIAYAPFRGANNPLLLERAQQTVTALSQSHDLVIVSMHMGAEGEEATRIPFADEYFHGELRGDSAAFAHAMVEAGADLVLGHGPHVPRALELYKGRLIAYSLGNFCTYYGINIRGLNGLAPILKVRLAQDGAFEEGEIISAQQYRPNGPLLDSSAQAAKLIAELTRLDFPQTPLEITNSGKIQLRNNLPNR